ncbi:hypothetical protein CBL_08826 [Carabus blaptoides fortunei]
MFVKPKIRDILHDCPVKTSVKLFETSANRRTKCPAPTQSNRKRSLATMKDHISAPEVIHKDVVVIGNGPSGIALSFMLSGHLPYLISRDHPDEMLSARLHSATGHSLAQQPLGHLAAGLEGRSTNPVSLLLDALEHPCADLGIEMASLVQWRYHKDKEIDHVVFGKGPPGGSWHSMDPNILTLSLGSWMALPVIPYSCVDNTDSQRRATASSVAQYYANYVKQMNLTKHFHNSVCVTSIQPITDPNQPMDTNQLGHDANHLAERPTTTTVDTNHVAENATVTLGNRIKYKSECGTVIKPVCEMEVPRRKCSFVSALNYIRARTKCHKQKPKDGVRTCKRPRDSVSKHDMSPNRKVRELIDKSYISLDQSLYLTRISREIDNTLYINDDEMLVCDAELLPPIRNQYRCDVNGDVDLLRPIRNDVDVYPPIRAHKYRYDQYGGRNKYRSFSFSGDSDFESNAYCDTVFNNNQKHNSLINISDSKLCRCFEEEKRVPMDDNCGMDILCECTTDAEDNTKARWIVNTVDYSTGQQITYTCNNLILANGSSDLPNRLGLSAETYDLPWVLHDLRSLENKLDHFAQCTSEITPDPVLIVGAGLSAADAVIATRFRSIPVLHVFRNRSVALDKQLPENMYPEYHKVHQMMVDGGSTYPLYTALPEHTVADISATDHTVTLLTKSGTPIIYKVSYVVILIGSRPNLTFLPAEVSLGVKKSTAIDAKSNPIDIDKMSHAVHGCDGLYAIGPLAGDNFVRFIPGGALAVVSDLYKHKNW